MVYSKENEGFVNNISIIIPFYLKLDLFRVTFPLNYPYFKNHEIVICLDHPSEEQGLLNLIKDYKDVKWKILVNPEIHSWRNCSIVLNTGVFHSTGDYIFIISPESFMKTDVIGQLVEAAKKYNDFACGFVSFNSLQGDGSIIENNKWYPYGSIAFSRENFNKVVGYSVLEGYGADDDLYRNKLKKIGCKGYYLPQTKIYHLEKGSRPNKQTTKENLELSQNPIIGKEIVIDENFELIYDTTL